MEGTDITQRYQYQALHRQDSIRILELLPGAAGTTLQCKLHEVRTSPQPSFEALSYTWGAPIFSKQLIETTSSSPSILSITENLFSALHALRLPHSSRKLWVDAVCINQQDTSEKSQQVIKMGEIYSDAARAVVWLGKEDCVAGAAQLQRIGQDCKLYGFEKIFPFPLKIHSPSAVKHLTKLAESCDGAAVLEFLDRQWFERVWIMQEFILAKDLVICSGKSRISYDIFSKAICVLRLMARRPALLGLIRKREQFWSMVTGGSLDLAWWLVQRRERHSAMEAQTLTTMCDIPPSGSSVGPASTTSEAENRAPDYNEENVTKLRGVTAQRAVFPLWDWDGTMPIHRSTLVEYCVGARKLKCTDERDRVFGMLGFAGDTLPIKPNYESSPEQLWNDLSLKSLLSGDLTVLHWARGVPINGHVKGFSFAADFGNINSEATRLGGNGIPKFQAGSQISAQVELISSGLPKLKGVLVDVVENGLGFAQASFSRPGEGNATTSSASKENGEHDQEQKRVDILKDDLLLVSKICSTWLSTSSFQYAEGSCSAFARTILADNTLAATQEVIGMQEKDIMLIYFVLLTLSLEVVELGDGRLFIPDTLVAEALGKPFSLTMFDGDEPRVYHFPSTDESNFSFTDPNNNASYTVVEVTEPLKTNLREYERAVSSILGSRSIFSTTKGYLGLGPKVILQKDEVVVFEGAQTPFVLRRIGVNAPEVLSAPESVQNIYTIYQVVGECYLHGWMYGEAMDKERGFELQEFVLI